MLLYQADAERHLLGSVLRDTSGKAMDTLMVQLEPSDFALPRHRELYDAMLSLATAGAAIDVITLHDHLGPDAMERVGGVSQITALFEGVPVATDLEYYVGLVKGYAKRRALKQAAQNILKLVDDNEITTDDAVGAAEQEITLLSEKRGDASALIGELASDVLTRLVKAKDGQRAGIDTGIVALDNALGGFQPDDLIVVGARPSMGKTAFAVTIGEYIAKSKAVLFYSLEMSRNALADRMILGGAGIEMWRVRAGRGVTNDDQLRALRRAEEIHAMPFRIDDASYQTVEGICAKSRAYARAFERNGTPLGCIFVDYLTYVKTLKWYERDELAVAAVTYGLKSLAKQLRVPVVLLAQLNRDLEKRPINDRRPKMSDFRASGAIEQDADVVLFPYRHCVYDREHDPRAAEIGVRKHRNGKLGDVQVSFIGERMRFVDIGVEL